MGINFYNEDVDMPLFQDEIIKKAIKYAIRIRKCRLGNINYIFCSDEYLLDINIKFLKHDYYTDVITFDYTEDITISGDIFVSIERVLNNAFILNENATNELVRVVAHGLLHLLGYKDKDSNEIAEMRKMEEIMINKYFGLLKNSQTEFFEESN